MRLRRYIFNGEIALAIGYYNSPTYGPTFHVQILAWKFALYFRSWDENDGTAEHVIEKFQHRPLWGRRS